MNSIMYLSNDRSLQLSLIHLNTFIMKYTALKRSWLLTGSTVKQADGFRSLSGSGARGGSDMAQNNASCTALLLHFKKEKNQKFY